MVLIINLAWCWVCKILLKVVDPILDPTKYILFSILHEQASLEQSNSKVWANIMQRF